MKLKLNPSKYKEEQDPAVQKKRKKKKIPRLGYFVFFLILSAIFWLIQTLQGTYQTTLTIPIIHEELPQRLGLDGAIPSHVEVALIDRGIELLLRSTIEPFAPIKLFVQQTRTGDKYIGLSRKELNAVINKRLSSRARVISFTPSEINIPIFKRSSKKVPIKLNFEPSASQGFITEAPILKPDSVIIYGNDEMLRKTKVIETEPFPHEGLTQTFKGHLNLRVPIEGMSLSISQAQVTIPVSELTERSFELEVRVEGEPDNKELVPLPGKATVQITIPKDRYNEVIPENLVLVVNYPTDAQELEEASLPLKLKGQPDWVVGYTIKPNRIQYVIQKK